MTKQTPTASGGPAPKSPEFKKAMKALPLCISGYDAWVHESPTDLAWLVLLQIDLHAEGDESDIRTAAQLAQCKRYLIRYPAL